MLKKTALAAAVIGSLACATANAGNYYTTKYTGSSYYGLNYADLTYADDLLHDELSLPAIYGRLGTTITRNISAEFRVGIGSGDDTLPGTEAELELDHMYGVYVRGGIPVSNTFFPYAVFGYTRGELTASVPGEVSVSASETDTSFGVGMDVNISPRFAINVEYMSYFDKNDAEIDSISVGVVGRF